METLKKINVAPSSTEGHYVKGAVNVVKLDEITESYYVKGKSKLVTKNHTDLEMEEDCMIICQQVLNPLTGLYEKSKD